MIVSTSILSELRFAVANFGPGSVEADGANRLSTAKLRSPLVAS